LSQNEIDLIPLITFKEKLQNEKLLEEEQKDFSGDEDYEGILCTICLL